MISGNKILRIQLLKFLLVTLFMLCISFNGTFAQGHQGLLVDLNGLRLSSMHDQNASSHKLRKVIQLKEGRQTLREVLQDIAGQAGLKLSYSEQLIPLTKEIQVKQARVTAEEALWRVLKGTSLRFGISATGQLFFFEMQKDNTVVQLEAVTGTVTDASTGETLPGVNVLVKGTSMGTATDVNGAYELTVESLQDTLVFSFIGYQRQEVPINGRTQIDIALQTQAIAGEELVVIGYGTVQKRDLTGSVSSVSAEDLENQSATSFDNALQGKLAGVRVIQSNGAPGGRTRIRIRGQNSVLGGSDPLYVIDGVPVISGSSGNTNLLASINPGDIESIDVLKDASATAIYGARGSNGVILITTKQGIQGQQRVDFGTSFGFSEVENKLNLMNTQQYVAIANERARNDGRAEPFPNPGAVPDINTDWMDEVFRSGFEQSYSLSTSGGDDDTRYAISTSYTNEKGTIIGSQFGRGSLRLNLDQDVNSKLRITPSLYISRTQNDRVKTEEGGDENNVLINAFMAPPFMTPRDNGGNFTPGTELKQFTFSPGSGDNPVALALEQLNRLTTDRVLANLSAQYDLTEGLFVKVLGGIDNVNNEVDRYTSRVLQAGRPAGTGSELRSTTTTFLNENTINYEGTFGADHRINATAGFTWQKEESESVNISASNFVTDDLLNNNLGAGENFTAPGSGAEEWTLISWLGRVNYTFKDRYLFTFTGRVDGSSRFGAGNKYAAFPSGAIAWRLSEEDFISQISQISNLKVRLSWGISGNQAIDPYRSVQQMIPQELVLGQNSSVGFAPDNLGNPELRWETTEQMDVGMDVGLWEERVRLSIDYYYKNTSDLLALVNLPPSTGFGSILRNVGSVRNQGFEVEAGTDILRGDFAWSIDANFSANNNEVTELARGADIIAEDVNIQGPANIIREGEPLSAFYGLQQDGLTDDGLFNYVDQNEDGEINNDDRVILGNPYPDFTYGFSMNFYYKGFSLSTLVQGEAGKEVWNSNKERGAVSMNRGYNQLEDVVNRWRPENPDPNAPFPKATGNLNVAPSSFFVEDASYLRISNVRLSYEVPVAKLNLPLRSATVYVSGQNLITFTDYSWFTPDVNSWGSGDLRIGVDRGSYPTNRTFTVGTKIGF